jgi:hypothetical protein
MDNSDAIELKALVKAIETTAGALLDGHIDRTDPSAVAAAATSIVSLAGMAMNHIADLTNVFYGDY